MRIKSYLCRYPRIGVMLIENKNREIAIEEIKKTRQAS